MNGNVNSPTHQGWNNPLLARIALTLTLLGCALLAGCGTNVTGNNACTGVVNNCPQSSGSSGQSSNPSVTTSNPGLSSNPLLEGTPDKTGSGITKSYNVTLRQDEVITGDTYQLVAQGQTYTNCIAYLITGPGSISYQLTDGQSLRYSGVTNQDQANQLLQARVDYLRQSPQNDCVATEVQLHGG